MDFLSVVLYVLLWILFFIFLRVGLVKVISCLFLKDYKEMVSKDKIVRNV